MHGGGGGGGGGVEDGGTGAEGVDICIQKRVGTYILLCDSFYTSFF